MDWSYIMVIVVATIGGIGIAFIACTLADAYLDDDEEDEEL